MTKLLKTALLLMLLALSCHSIAQTRIPREVHLGLIGGANLSEYTFYPRVTQQMSQGYTAGVGIRYIEETLFGLQAELHLTRRGYSDFYEEQPDWNYSRSLTYIELPVMAHIYFRIGDHHEVAVDLGPKVGYFLFDNINNGLPADFGQVDSESYGYTYEHHDMPIEKKLDYGIQAGLGYEFKFNKKMSMLIQGRYYYGLGNLWADTKADKFQQSSCQSIQIVMALWWRHTIRGKKVKK